ncbi:hypothetical protein Hypma_002164 [Hypsizygus marmoreus]|uniref:Uncharacterized protein n=1 Tax=Hypsizygus marmoreus TaxID=39966 RepID=A0A369K005_HYPMA|nr:hypothetical protein Hypma_002164 [Hypsizygus marmoreus]
MFKDTKAKVGSALADLTEEERESVRAVENQPNVDPKLQNVTFDKLQPIIVQIRILEKDIKSTNTLSIVVRKQQLLDAISRHRSALKRVVEEFMTESQRRENADVIHRTNASISSMTEIVRNASEQTVHPMGQNAHGGQVSTLRHGGRDHGRRQFSQLSQALSADMGRYPSTVSREFLQSHPPGGRILSPNELAEHMMTITVSPPAGFNAPPAVSMPGESDSTRARTSMGSISSSRSQDSTQAQAHYPPSVAPSHWVRRSENQSHDSNDPRHPASQMPGRAVQSSSSNEMHDSGRVGHNRQSSMASEVSNQTTYSFGPGNTAYKAHHAHAKPDATKKDLMHKDGPRMDVTRGEEKSQVPAIARTGLLPAQSQSQSASQAPRWVARSASQQAPTSSIQSYAPTHAGAYYAAPHQQPPVSSGGYAPSGQYRQQVPQGSTAGPGFQGSATPAHQVPFVPPVEPPVEHDHIEHPAYPGYVGNAQAGPSCHHAHGGHAHQAPKEYPKRI